MSRMCQQQFMLVLAATARCLATVSGLGHWPGSSSSPVLAVLQDNSMLYTHVCTRVRMLLQQQHA